MRNLMSWPGRGLIIAAIVLFIALTPAVASAHTLQQSNAAHVHPHCSGSVSGSPYYQKVRVNATAFINAYWTCEGPFYVTLDVI